MSTINQATPTITQWRIDRAHSSVEFAVKHMMFTTVRGRFADMMGVYNRTPAMSPFARGSVDQGGQHRYGRP